jgi:hypothetical protein
VGKTIRALLGRWGGKEGCFEFCYIFCFCNIRGLRAGRICLGMGICALRFRFYFMISQFILGFSLIAGGGGVESLILGFPGQPPSSLNRPLYAFHYNNSIKSENRVDIRDRQPWNSIPTNF